MTRIRVDIDALEHLTDRMQRFQDHLVVTRDDVQHRVRGLHASWTGHAAAEQAAAHESWLRAVDELTTALAVLRSIAANARSNYAAACAANRGMWAS